MDKYEISIWEDYLDKTSNNISFLNEKKIAIIGSDTMKSPGRAIEPNLVEEINGTNTFTFKMYYTYIDSQTGEKCDNPFIKYLVNERKVKVYWKNKWYDLVIKKCLEDTSQKFVTYTCKDLFINELSKQGYSLEFDTELQNNIGTVGQLASAVLEDSTWNYDEKNSDIIYQKTESPVYEIQINNNITNAYKQPNGTKSETIPKNKQILVFYDSLLNIKNGDVTDLQFVYTAEEYQTDVNDDLVINGNCYKAEVTWTVDNNKLTAKIGMNSITIFTINLANTSVSSRYRAERYVQNQKTIYDPVLERYVGLCEDKNTKEPVYEIVTTEYSDPLMAINLIANPTEFTNTSGWINSKVQKTEIYPKFNENSNIEDYTAKSYLRINAGAWVYNNGLQSNISYFTATDSEIKQGKLSGIQKGERFVFRIKIKNDNSGAPSANYLGENDAPEELNAIDWNIAPRTKDYKKTGTPYFKGIAAEPKHYNDGWIEQTVVCNTSIPLEKFEECGIFIAFFKQIDGVDVYNSFWVEDVQFFREIKGKDSEGNIIRIDPGKVSLQSYAQQVYKYYKPKTKLEDISYLYIGNTRQLTSYPPIMNNYEKVGTITEKESNRFNILQSIAETFQAWVRFRIDHEENGATKFIDGIPQKFVYFKSDYGEDTGISFEYGIDLKTISRTIDSDKIATKIIVNPNSNEFAPNGFCSIARSNQNPTKENFIINLDYFTQQNLIDKNELNKDLYQQNGLAYYNSLYKWNSEYDTLTEELSIKQLDLIKQQSQQEIYKQYILSAKEQLENIKSDVMNLAGVSTWKKAEAYARNHKDNEKVQSLLNSYAQVNNEIEKNQNLLAEITTSINTLNSRITTITNRQEDLKDKIKEKHKAFNNKYSTYLMEGTWQDEDYVDEDKYYLDALKIAYTSSRPQLSYTINVLRLSSLEEYSSKVFNLGDICYMQDREFFGYLSDKKTPYKEKILVSKISSFFDQPEKDILTIQNYKTRFDDLFQRIAATVQSLSYSENSFTRAAETFNKNGTIRFQTLQDTFDQNFDLVLNSSNQDVIWDNTGITVKNKVNKADQTKIIAGGIFVTNDGGNTWKNAVRGDGISTELLTAGRINTSEIYIYDGNAPSFRWDSYGLTAYSIDNGSVDFNKFVRHDRYGFYGYNGSKDFKPSNENDIWEKASFGMTWKGFFLKSSSTGGSLEISTGNDLIVKNSKGKERIRIGSLNKDNDNYGIIVNNSELKTIFKVDNNGASIGGWSLTENSIYHETIGFYSEGKNATVQGNKADYYILAGSNFGVTIDGNIYANAGKIGGWTINADSISAEVKDKGYTVIQNNGTLYGEGKIIYDKKKGKINIPYQWSIGPNGFKFTSETSTEDEKDVGNVIQLGNTIINNHYLYTENISASGGSIGGCTISSGGISGGGGWTLSSKGLTLNGTELDTGTIHSITGITLEITKTTIDDIVVVTGISGYFSYAEPTVLVTYTGKGGQSSIKNS